MFGYRSDLENLAWLAANSVEFMPAVKGCLVPDEIDPRPWHRIENQGSMGSCQGHAQSSVCEMAYHIATGEVIQFSPLFAYYATQKLDGLFGRDNGSTIAGGCQSAMQNGSCPLNVMPYPNPVRYTGQFTPGAYNAAAAFKIRAHSVCKNYDEVFAYLASGQGGVEIGIGWGNLTPNSEGVIEQYRPGPGGHAVCFLGYSKRVAAQGRKYLWLANSWGAEMWGNSGWAEVSPNAVDQMCQGRDTVIIGMSDMQTPKPREISWTGKDSMFRLE